MTKKRKTWLIVLVIVLLLATGGSYFAHTGYFAQAQDPSQPALQTATVTRGDITITADGSGELTAARDLELTIRASGVLSEVLVAVGDQVNEDDVLAHLETEDLERAVAEANVEMTLAQLELADVREGPSEAELTNAQAALRSAQVEQQVAREAYEDTVDSNQDTIVDTRKIDYDYWVGYYQKQKAKYEAGELSQIDHDWAMAAMIEAEGEWQEALNQAQIEETQAGNRLTQAQNTVYQAQEDLELLESEPLTDTLLRAELDVDQALMTLEEARADLEAAQLYAPFDGVVMEVTATEGEQVGTNTSILTLADLQEPLLRFWMEETDAGNVAVGDRVNVTFEALPDDVFSGEVVRVEPVLVTVDGTTAVQAQARLDLTDREVTFPCKGEQSGCLLSGMTADVEVVAAEVLGATLVPVEALHESSDTSSEGYTVYVVKPDGELEMRAVKIGLQDAVNAEVLTGLEVGEVVRVGESQ